MQGERFLLEISEGVAHLKFNRPQAHNAVDGKLCEELRAMLMHLEKRDDYGALLVSAEGKNFCVGGDLRFFTQTPQAERTSLGRSATYDLHGGIQMLTNAKVPVVLAAQGAIAGAGLGFVAAADISLVAADARFTVAYTAVGLTPDTGVSYFLPRAVGYRRALDLTLTNRPFSAAEALAWGLVSRVVAPESLLAEAKTLAAQLARGPRDAYRKAKRLLRQGVESSLEAQLENESVLFAAALGSDAGDEGMRAFLEKRAPEFRAN